MTTEITSVTELSNWDGTGTALLMNDIVITSAFTPVVIQPGGTFDGGGNSITFNYTGAQPAPGIFITWSTSNISNLLFIASAPITSFLASGISTIPQPDGGAVLNQVELVYEFPVLTNCGGLIGGSGGAPYLIASSLVLNNCKFSGELIEHHSAAFVPFNTSAYLIKVGASFIFNDCIANVKISVTEGVDISIYASSDQSSSLECNNCIVRASLAPANNANVYFFCYGNGNMTLTNCYVYYTGTANITTSVAYTINASPNPPTALVMSNCYQYGPSSGGSTLAQIYSVELQTVTFNYCATSSSVLTPLSSGSYTNNNSVTGLTNTPPDGYEPFASYNSNGYGTEWSHVGEDGYNKPLPLTVFTTAPWSEYSIYSDNPVLYYSGPLPCLVKDTLILTSDGYVPVQDLKEGDVLPNLDGDVTTVTGVFRRIIHKDDKESVPYMIPKDYLAPGVPFENLRMSQNHAYYHNGEWHHPKCSIPGLRLTESKGVEYYHVQTTNYFDDVIVANGLEVETYARGADKHSKWDCSFEKCCFTE